MDLDEIIRSMADQQSPETLTKTASAAPIPRVSTNTVSTDPVAGLLKMAQELVASEKTAEAEHLSLLGAAFADAAINRFAAYDSMTKQAAAQEAVPTAYGDNQNQAVQYAQQVQQTQYEQEKQAAYEDAIFKEAAINEAMEFGAAYEAEIYKEAAIREAQSHTADMQKQAEFEAGVNDAVAVISQAAVHEFYKGAATAQIMIEQLKQG